MNDVVPVTPLMKQYFEIKQRYPDTLLMFQVGDFYELFYEDAQKAAAFLGITLTARGKNNGDPIPLCGVPVHALDYYVVKLVQGGFRIAICNQLEEAKPGKVVQRGVTQVLTPGTLTDSKLLDAKSASYLFSFFPSMNQWGLVFGELLTAQLYATVIPLDTYPMLESELVRFFPDEIIIPDTARHYASYFSRLGYCTTINTVNHEIQNSVTTFLEKQFRPDTIQTLNQNHGMRGALETFLGYLKHHQEAALDNFKQINFYRPDDFLMLDMVTQRNLELIKNCHDSSRKNTLFEHLDEAATPMGSRVIKKWIVRPLLKHDVIVQRQEVIQELITDIAGAQKVRTLLATIGDLERIVGRIALRRASVSDYVMLTQGLDTIPHLYVLLQNYAHCSLIHGMLPHLNSFEQLKNYLRTALNNDPDKEWIINAGFDPRLDHVRNLVEQSNALILALEKQEQEKTGIASLKVRYNQVHGYYIEVTKPNAHLIPDDYIRHQTLVGKERFTTPDLKNLERDILVARTEIEQIEKELYEKIKTETILHVPSLRKLSLTLAHVDALLSLATVAYNDGYVRPTFNDQGDISIEGGKHPIVERNLAHRFISNDTMLTHEQRLWLITGPNMGGKSTYLRQVALLCIMAQCGSFVPARKASFPLLDRIFTRIGAGDNVAEGKSTFLIEMEETALICSQATAKSLVILDEVGRGTSTFDGLAIAQAVVEYIYSVIKARCLFATHYHELTTLEQKFPGIVSYYAASKKTDHGILLLYKIMRGIADGSFGIEVAKLAALPPQVIERADAILHDLIKTEKKDVGMSLPPSTDASQVEYQRLQEALYILEEKIKKQNALLSDITSLDFQELSPKKAFDVLWRFKEHDLV